MISDRDKKILAIFLMVAIVVGAFFFGSKITKKNEEYDIELKTLKERSADLDYKNNKRADFIEDKDRYTEVFNKVYADYNTWISQENVLLFLSSIEKNTKVKIDQMSLNVTTEIYKFGEVRSTNPSRRGSIVYNTDNIGITTTSNISYKCTYDELKDVLTYIKENGRKVTIDSITYTYDRSNDKVIGTMGLSFFAIAGSDRPVQSVDIKDVFVGTDNIFASSTFIPDNNAVTTRDVILSTYDLYLIVNKTDANMDAVVCGQRGDLNNQTMISSNDGGSESVTIRVTGTAGDYRVSYEIGSRIYPAENYDAGAPFVCGDSIELLIMSSKRGGITDANQISLRLINETDLVVNAAIVNDDELDKRINIEETRGTINFH